MNYEPELSAEYGDDSTMVENLVDFTTAVIGHRIISVEKLGYAWGADLNGALITLDNGKVVQLRASNDCCAYTELESFLLHPERVDHIITGVGTTNGFTTWHIYADMGDVLSLNVEWSAGSGCYIYGFHISVEDAERDA